MNLDVIDLAILEIIRCLKRRGVITQLRHIVPEAGKNDDHPPVGFEVDTKVAYWMILPSEVFIRWNWSIVIEEGSGDVVVLVKSVGNFKREEGWQKSSELKVKPARHIYPLDDPKCFDKVADFAASLRPSDPSCGMLTATIDIERMKADMEKAKAENKEFDTNNQEPYFRYGTGIMVEHTPGEPERLVLTDDNLNKLPGEVGVDHDTLNLLLKKDPVGTFEKYRALFRDTDGVPLKGNKDVKKEEVTQ